MIHANNIMYRNIPGQTARQVQAISLHLTEESIIELAYLLRRALNTLDPQEYKDWNELSDRLDYGRPLEGISL